MQELPDEKDTEVDRLLCVLVSAVCYRLMPTVEFIYYPGKPLTTWSSLFLGAAVCNGMQQ